jgi:hypothetical protein
MWERYGSWNCWRATAPLKTQFGRSEGFGVENAERKLGGRAEALTPHIERRLEIL